MFKLNRMNQLSVKEEHFIPVDCPVPDFSGERMFGDKMHVKAVFEPEMKWRIVDEYGVESIQTQHDGRLLFEGDYCGKAEMLSWILSFGDRVVIIEPESIRTELQQIVVNLYRMYTED